MWPTFYKIESTLPSKIVQLLTKWFLMIVNFAKKLELRAVQKCAELVDLKMLQDKLFPFKSRLWYSRERALQNCSLTFFLPILKYNYITYQGPDFAVCWRAAYLPVLIDEWLPEVLPSKCHGNSMSLIGRAECSPIGRRAFMQIQRQVRETILQKRSWRSSERN